MYTVAQAELRRSCGSSTTRRCDANEQGALKRGHGTRQTFFLKCQRTEKMSSSFSRKRAFSDLPGPGLGSGDDVGEPLLNNNTCEFETIRISAD